MKIEMGESLMLSWLKHAKECKITQLNWKPSTNWQTFNDKAVEDLYKKMTVHFPVFKNNSNYEQVIKQAELDVLGLSYEKNNLAYYYAIDIAYHESGLNYGSKEETIDRISKKFLRAALVLYHYFDVKEGEIIFASPKINQAIYNDLDIRIKQIQTFMQTEGFSFQFKLFANESFTENILNPIIEISSTVADTSELFMRAFQLSNLCQKNTVKTRNYSGNNTNLKIQYNEFKIGTTVQNKLSYLFYNNLLSKNDILNLKDEKYCKKVFNLSFPLLIDINESRFDKKGHARYWNKVFAEKYWACNHWYENQRSMFESWYSAIREKSTQNLYFFNTPI